jgi:hypothetical protein
MFRLLFLSRLVSSSLGNGLGILLVGPIEGIVILESLTGKEVTEDLAEVRVVWLFIKTKGTSIA